MGESRDDRAGTAIPEPASPADPASANNSLLFMIVDEGLERAENLKELIEFMDVPQVEVMPPDNWRSRIGDRRLAAVFLSNDLDPHKLRSLISDVGDHDPNVPIVLVNRAETHA